MKIIKKETLFTERLTLKPFSNEDCDRLVYFFQNKKISKTFMIPEFESKQEYEELAKKIISFSQLDDHKHLEYGIYLDNILIGFINDCGFDDTSIEIGYVIDPVYQSKGYAKEAVKRVLVELKEMGFNKVIASYFDGNIASKKVMEACGLEYNGTSEWEQYRGKKYLCHYHEKIL